MYHQKLKQVQEKRNKISTISVHERAEKATNKVTLLMIIQLLSQWNCGQISADEK